MAVNSISQNSEIEEITDEAYSEDEAESLEDFKHAYHVSMDKNTNLHFSSATGIIDQMKEDLKDKNQKIDAENFMGWTPLMFAVRNGQIEATKLLLEKGADVTKKNNMGMNIFNLSVAAGNIELMDMILTHMLKGGISKNFIQENLSPISLSIILKKNYLTRYLIAQKFDINCATAKTGLTPLMFAASRKLDGIISLLSEKGADTEARNYMKISYTEISRWCKLGIKLVQPVDSIVNDKNCDVNANSNQTAVTTIPFVQGKASPLPPREEVMIQKAMATPINPQAKEFIPKVHHPPKLVVPQNFHEDPYAYYNVQNQEMQHLAPSMLPSPMGPQLKPTDKKYEQHFQKTDDSFITYQLQSPFNGLPFPVYMPLMNSPYGRGPHTPVSPMILTPPSFSFTEMGNKPQNTPINVMPPSHLPLQPNQFFFGSPMIRPDNFGYDGNLGVPNGYPVSPMFCTVLPNGAYSISGHGPVQ